MHLKRGSIALTYFVAAAAASTITLVYASPRQSSVQAKSSSTSIAISPQVATNTSTTTATGEATPQSPTSPDSGKASASNEKSTESTWDSYPAHNKFFHTMEEINNMPEEELQRRPLLYWRRWANKPPHVGLLCVFLFLETLAVTEFFKTATTTARDCCRKHFWRCLGRGFFLAVVLLSFARMLLIDPIGTPAAYLLIAIGELLSLAGLAVGSTLLSEAILRRLWLADKLSRRPFIYRLSLSLWGTIILGFILAIPGVGAFPPVGIRLVSWISLLGVGALLKTQFGKRPV